MKNGTNSYLYHWSPMLIECYNRVKEGKSCKDCNILPKLETINICTLKYTVKCLMKEIGPPQISDKFMGVDITPSMKVALERVKEGTFFEDLTNTQKCIMPDLYLIAEARGFKAKNKTRKYYEFMKFVHGLDQC